MTLIKSRSISLLLLAGVAATMASARGNEVFSGPQPGEKTTAFKALELRGPSAGQERDPIAEHQGAPTALVFVHGVERSMAPLLSVIDQYGHERASQLKTEFIFLSGDRLSSQQRLPMVGNSLRIQSPMSLSVDGVEGPGNYGLNKECLMTIVLAKENRVTANFALVQPGIADGERVIASMAKLIGDDNPPSPEALREKRGAGYGRMQAERNMERRREMANQTRGDLPGAAPTDERLVGYLRRFIQKSNEDATVDRVLAEVETYIQGNEDLTQQAINGWIRVLHVKYGTDYAQKTGQSWVEKLQKASAKP